MQFAEFERLIKRLTREIPAEYLDGIAAIDVSPKTIPDPVRADVYTLGECIPLHGNDEQTQSRVVLYHGSFRALAQLSDDFSWRDEAWDTLTHELRHHLEWRASTDRLADYDWAAEQNFARHDGQPFDPVFHLSGEQAAPGVFRVDDDVFLDRPIRRRPARLEMSWHGVAYAADVPALPLPLFLVLDGVREPPPGELVAVLRHKPRLRDLVRRAAPPSVARAIARPEPRD
jgi:hypothetical protein